MQKKNVVSYLENMVGKEVKIYKDGPESKTGRLISVNKDLIAIKTENNQTVYYQLKHIKSIIENAKHGKVWDAADAEDEIKATNFQHLLKQLLQQKIQINGGGPAHRIAKVLEVKDDYVILQLKNNEVIYYQLEHIKSISPVDEKSSSDGEESNESSDIESENMDKTEFDETPDYMAPVDFESLLRKLKHNWVIVNGKGPEHIHGILVDCALDHVVLVHHDEVYRIYTYHIKNISLGVKKGHKLQKEEANGKEKTKETEPEEKETTKKLVKYSSKVSKDNNENTENKNKGENTTKFQRKNLGPKKP